MGRDNTGRAIQVADGVLQAVPAGLLTWEVRALLSDEATESNGQNLEITGPCILTGCYASVRPAEAFVSALEVPDLDDVLVSIAINKLQRLTDSDRSGSANPQPFSAYVSMGAMTSDFGRRGLMAQLPEGTHTVQIKFAWRQGQPAADEMFVSVICGLAFYIARPEEK